MSTAIAACRARPRDAATGVAVGVSSSMDSYRRRKPLTPGLVKLLGKIADEPYFADSALTVVPTLRYQAPSLKRSPAFAHPGVEEILVNRSQLGLQSLSKVLEYFVISTHGNDFKSHRSALISALVNCVSAPGPLG